MNSISRTQVLRIMPSSTSSSGTGSGERLQTASTREQPQIRVPKGDVANSLATLCNKHEIIPLADLISIRNVKGIFFVL